MLNHVAEFLAALSEELPGFREQSEEHAQLYDETLPHVLVADATRLVIAAHRRATRGDFAAAKTVDRVLRVFESALDRGDAVRELVALSFLDNLHQAGDEYEGLRAKLGNRLRAELARLE